MVAPRWVRWRRGVVQLACALCILGILAALVAGCSGGIGTPSDEEVRAAAEKFAQLLKAGGKTAEEILELARKEADKWGPRAQIFIDTVIAELRK